MNRLIAIGFLFLAIGLWSCGGSGGNGEGDGNGEMRVEFIPAVTDLPSKSVSLNQKETNGAEVVLLVVVKELATLSVGAAFDLEFNPDIVNFIGFSPGDFYESSGEVSYQVGLQEETNNRLVFGITQQAGSGAIGSGTIIELQFKAIGTGSSDLTFTNNNLIDPDNEIIPSITWSGGIITGS